MDIPTGSGRVSLEIFRVTGIITALVSAPPIRWLTHFEFMIYPLHSHAPCVPITDASSGDLPSNKRRTKPSPERWEIIGQLKISA